MAAQHWDDVSMQTDVQRFGQASCVQETQGRFVFPAGNFILPCSQPLATKSPPDGSPRVLFCYSLRRHGAGPHGPLPGGARLTSQSRSGRGAVRADCAAHRLCLPLPPFRLALARNPSRTASVTSTDGGWRRRIRSIWRLLLSCERMTGLGVKPVCAQDPLEFLIESDP